MWKKEFSDALKQTALVLSFLFLMPLVFGINQMRFANESLSFTWYINWGMNFLLPILILYLSYKMFASEDSDEAIEYMKSLPINKWKLLAIKILPRFVMIVGIAYLYHSIFMADLLYMGSFSWFYYSARPASIIYTSLLILIPLIYGFMLGISNRKSPILYCAFLIPVLHLPLARDYWISPLSRVLYNLWWPHFQHTNINIFFLLDSFFEIYLPAILPIVVLIPIFKSWDCSSGKVRSERIIKRMAIPLGLIITLYAVSKMKLF